jgi:hypothetical protein
MNKSESKPPKPKPDAKPDAKPDTKTKLTPSIYDDDFYKLIQTTRPQERPPNQRLLAFFNPK